MAFNQPDRPDSDSRSIEVVHDADTTQTDEAPVEQSSDGEAAPIEEASSRVLNEHFEKLEAPDWTPPFYVRFRLLSIAALTASVAWLMASAYYVLEHLGFEELTALLPHEIGGMVAGIAVPIALLWIVVAFYERSKLYRAEARALRWHLKQLTYPSDAAETRVAEITETLRA